MPSQPPIISVYTGKLGAANSSYPEVKLGLGYPNEREGQEGRVRTEKGEGRASDKRGGKRGNLAWGTRTKERAG
jgi:hypothetical protein